MINKFALLIFSLSISFSSFSGGWTGFQKIDGIIVEGNAEGTSSWAMINLDGGVNPDLLPEGCKGGAMVIYLDSEKGRAMLALALSARMADKSIRVSAGVCAKDTISTRAEIGNIWL